MASLTPPPAESSLGTNNEPAASTETHNSPDERTYYSEKLWPAASVWMVVALISCAGILVLAPISLQAGLIAAVVLVIIQSTLLIVSTPLLCVTDSSVQVGKAQIERKFITNAEAFLGKEASAERGVNLNGLAFLCFRGWISPVIKITISDPQDATPYWLASSRNPQKMVQALGFAETSNK